MKAFYIVLVTISMLLLLWTYLLALAAQKEKELKIPPKIDCPCVKVYNTQEQINSLPKKYYF